MGNHFLKHFLVLLVLTKLKFAQHSPCPEYFLFEPDKSEADRWYGIVILKNAITHRGVSLQLQFDKQVIQLGNSFGRVQSNADHTEFIITNTENLRADRKSDVQFYVVYDPTEITPPQLTKIILNGVEICPNKPKVKNEVPVVSIEVNLPKCGVKTVTTTALIVHGENTKEGDWPWHTAVYRKQGNKREYICGGTLISNKHVLTAAHCASEGNTNNPRDSDTLSVTLGKYGIYVQNPHEQTMDISKVILHPNFNRTNLRNDISVLVTIGPLQFDDYVKPICLWEEDLNVATIVNRFGTTVGWGRDENNNSVSDLLKGLKMPVIDLLQCIREIPIYATLTNENTLCAGYRNGSSVCNGDSGGGLVFPKTGTNGIDTVWQIRGIVSNTIATAGNVCDPNYYVIFTDVARYINWIKMVTN